MRNKSDTPAALPRKIKSDRLSSKNIIVMLILKTNKVGKINSLRLFDLDFTREKFRLNLPYFSRENYERGRVATPVKPAILKK